MKIGEISIQTGVSQRMIRHFESMNIITPKRNGNYRSYTQSDLKIIVKIKDFQLACPIDLSRSYIIY